MNSNMFLEYQLPREETSADGAERQPHPQCARPRSLPHSHTLWFQETPAPNQSCASPIVCSRQHALAVLGPVKVSFSLPVKYSLNQIMGWGPMLSGSRTLSTPSLTQPHELYSLSPQMLQGRCQQQQELAVGVPQTPLM